jgi:fluoride exporter
VTSLSADARRPSGAVRRACDHARVTAALVALTGAGGVLLRYGLSSSVHGDALPWVTAAINVVGSFLLGMLVVAHWASPQTRTVLGVGLLGGLTTFSTWSVQAFLDVEAGQPVKGLLLILTSVALGLGGAAAGYYLGRAVW